MQVVRFFCACLLIVFAVSAAVAQFPIKIPKITKEKPKPVAQEQEQTAPAETGSTKVISQVPAATAPAGKAI